MILAVYGKITEGVAVLLTYIATYVLLRFVMLYFLDKSTCLRKIVNIYLFGSIHNLLIVIIKF